MARSQHPPPPPPPPLQTKASIKRLVIPQMEVSVRKYIAEQGEAN